MLLSTWDEGGCCFVKEGLKWIVCGKREQPHDGCTHAFVRVRSARHGGLWVSLQLFCSSLTEAYV